MVIGSGNGSSASIKSQESQLSKDLLRKQLRNQGSSEHSDEVYLTWKCKEVNEKNQAN